MEIITEHPILPGAMHALISQKRSGSVVFHYAVVKEQRIGDKATAAMEYQPVGDTVAELRDIASDLRLKWELEDVLLVRRIGTLRIGDVISLVAVSSPNSQYAFAACQNGISRMKTMLTIQKNEIYR